MTCWPSRTSVSSWPVPDSGRPYDVAGLTAFELALARPDSLARGPILARLRAIDAESAERAPKEVS
jgi:hypothetical protein